MKRIKKWHVAVMAIVAVLVAGRIVAGKPLPEAILEAVKNINFLALLGVLMRVSTIDFAIVLAGLLPAMMVLAYQAESQTINWQTRMGNLRWRQVQRWQKKCRDKYCAPVFAVALGILALRQDVVCLGLLMVGAFLVWGIDTGKIKMKRS